MFVRSLMNVEVTYRKSAGDTVLKPQTVTFVDEKIVSAEELKACYGDRIVIIPVDKEEEVLKETTGITEDETVGIAEDDIKVVADFLNEVKNDNISIPDGVEVDKEQLQKVIDFVEGKIDKLPDGMEVDKEQLQKVIDFVEGKTDELPEGTEVITKESTEGTEVITKESTGGTTKEGTIKKEEPKRTINKKGSKKGSKK